MTTPPSHTVLIVGAGLAGLTAAYHLHQQGYHITLLDCPDWHDGFRTDASDPMPITLGCHHETKQLLRLLDQGRPAASDHTIPLEFRLPNGRIIPYQSAHLPGALQWMMSFFSFAGLSWHDRWNLFSHVEQIWEQAETLPEDLENRTADDWLTAIGQSAEARTWIWAPLAQWLTGNALERLSAATFVHILSTVFLRDAADARLTHHSGTVDQRVISPLREILVHHNVQIVSLTEPPTLRLAQDRVQEIRLPNGTPVQARWYVIALSYQDLLRLLPERFLTRFAYCSHVTELQSLSEIVVQLTYCETNHAPRLLLLADRLFHQLTRASIGSDHVIYRLAATTSSLMELPDEQIVGAAQAEVRALFPDLSQHDPTSRQLFRRNHAALVLGPGAARLRPLQQSPLQNLLVAGAWTDTGWPATTESALVSARRCADIVTGHTT